MNASPFDERFALLLESGQATQPILDLTQRLVRQVEADYGLTLDEGNGGMFVTHAAVALQRLADDAPLDAPPPVVVDEARTLTVHWAYAHRLAETIRDALGKPVPEGEIGYLTLHLARIAQEAET